MRTKIFSLDCSSNPMDIRETLESHCFDFQKWQNGTLIPQNFAVDLWSPIVDARVKYCIKKYDEENKVRESNRFVPNEKPAYVLAEIETKHLCQGESTNIDRRLRNAICARGKLKENGGYCDNCGHIIAKILGGKMVHFNLFPQDPYINCGWSGLSNVWKIGVEALIVLWLTIQAQYDPMVRFHVGLKYLEDSTDYPDRPSSMHFIVEFWKRPDNSSKSESDDEKNLRSERIIVALMANLVENNATAISTEEIVNHNEKVRLFKDSLTKLCDSTQNIELKDFLRTNIEILEQILKKNQSEPVKLAECKVEQTPQNKAASSDSGWFWDLVPIIGPIRILGYALEFAKKGNIKGCAINLVRGAGGLMLDVFTLGSGAIVLKSAYREAAKLGVRQLKKQVVIVAATEAIRQAGYQSVLGGFVGAAFGGMKGAGKGMIRGAMTGACRGALYGGACGAINAAKRQAERDAAKAAMEQAERDAAKAAMEQAERDAAKAAMEQAERDAAKAAMEQVDQMLKNTVILAGVVILLAVMSSPSMGPKRKF